MPRRDADWTQDQLLLALDLYLRKRRGNPSKRDPDLRTLSRVTEVLARADGMPAQARSVDAISMKLQNFKVPDPLHEGGLPNIGSRDQQVWDAFADAPDRLRAEVGRVLDRAVAAGWDGEGWYWDALPDLRETSGPYQVLGDDQTAPLARQVAVIAAFYRSLGYVVAPSPAGSLDQLRCAGPDGEVRHVCVRIADGGGGFSLTPEEVRALNASSVRAALYVVAGDGSGRLLRAEDPWELDDWRLEPVAYAYRVT